MPRSARVPSTVEERDEANEALLEHDEASPLVSPVAERPTFATAAGLLATTEHQPLLGRGHAGGARMQDSGGRVDAGAMAGAMTQPAAESADDAQVMEMALREPSSTQRPSSSASASQRQHRQVQQRSTSRSDVSVNVACDDVGAGRPARRGQPAGAELEEGEDEDQQMELKYGAEQVIALIVPVSLCMAIVVATVQSVQYYATDSGTYLYYVAFTESGNQSGAELFGGALVNALIIIGIILVMTCVLVVLYKYRCYKVRARARARTTVHRGR